MTDPVPTLRELQGRRPRELPDFLFDRPSDNPDEDVMTGNARGPGAGPEVLKHPPGAEEDEREAFLRQLAAQHDSQVALDTLASIRNERRDNPLPPKPWETSPPEEAPSA